MELATVIAVHHETEPPYYTVTTAGGAEVQTEANRLSLQQNKPKAPPAGPPQGKAMGLAVIPAFKGGNRARIGHRGDSVTVQRVLAWRLLRRVTLYETRLNAVRRIPC